MPTATAVVGDILDLARDGIGLGRPRLGPLGFSVSQLRKARVRPIGSIVSEFYLRVEAELASQYALALARRDSRLAAVDHREAEYSVEDANER